QSQQSRWQAARPGRFARSCQGLARSRRPARGRRGVHGCRAAGREPCGRRIVPQCRRAPFVRQVLRIGRDQTWFRARSAGLGRAARCGARLLGGVRSGACRRRQGAGGHGVAPTDPAAARKGGEAARRDSRQRRSRHRRRHELVPAGANAGSWRIIPSSGPHRHFGARLPRQPELAALRFAGEQAGVAAVGRFHGFLPRPQKGPSLMSPVPGPQVGGVAAMPGTSIVFDDAFRARLRDLLVWRRDVRRFRRDPLPSGTMEALIESACLAPSVGLSQPWRFVIVDDEAIRAAIRRNFATCNAAALAAQSNERAGRYAKLKLAGLEEAPCHFAVFADRGTTQGHGVGRLTMPEMIEYSAVTAVHTIWLVARAQGIGMGWVSILDPKAVAALLDVPVEWKFIGYFCLGYPQLEDTVPELEQMGWEQRRLSSSVVIKR